MTSARLAVCAACLAMVAATGASASLTFVGSWAVDSGPAWLSNPRSYTGQEAAALLFGGAPSDYSISTNGTNPALVNFSAWEDGWGDRNTYGSTTPAPQNFDLQTGTGYDDPGGGGTSYSAYVSDHGVGLINYAFVGSPAPEPVGWALMLVGLGAVGGSLRARRQGSPAPN